LAHDNYNQRREVMISHWAAADDLLTITILVPLLYTLHWFWPSWFAVGQSLPHAPVQPIYCPLLERILHPSYVCPSWAHFLPDWTNDAPHRARMSDSLLETLVYLKGNAHVFWLYYCGLQCGLSY